MKALNLAKMENGTILYKISRFPDGQQDIVIDKISTTSVQNSDTIYIHSRFNSFKDLELIICATKALKRLKFKKIGLVINYLLGARSDREFQLGGTSYLVDVVAPIINAQKFEEVIVRDVHSDVAAACINNLTVISNENFVKWALSNLWRSFY